MLDFSFAYRTGGFVLAPTLTADRGLTALYGPSGAGKSLTLLCLAGLLRPDTGWVRLNGRTLLDASAGIHVPAHQRKVGVVFQEYALFPHLTVVGNLSYGLNRLPRADAQERVQAMLRLLRLEGFAARYPGDLSGGQRQRVALGRGLIVQPELLLLDEPLSALDQMERERLRDEVMELLAGFGGTTLLVTHSLQEAYIMAKEIAVIDGGRILQAGPREEVLRHPRTRRVAEHVGASNIFQGEVIGPSTLSWHGVPLQADEPLPPPGSIVRFCVRPEDVRLVWPDRVAGRVNVVSGRLVREAKRDVDYLLSVRADGGPAEAGDITIHSPEHLHFLMKLQPGMGVWIALPPDRLHVLETEDAER